MYRLKVLLHGKEVRELALESGREYVFGRASTCDVQLDEQQGISRTHFKLVEENGNWTAQVLAKFGGITAEGRPVQSLILEAGTAFKLAGYDFHFVGLEREEVASNAVVLNNGMSDDIAPSNTLPVAVGSDHYQNSMPRPGSPGSGQASFDGNDDATRVFAREAEVPYLRVIERDQREQLIRLDGRRWLAGREQGCDILLDDRKASRRQFELSSTAQGYFVRDLASSNGTSLNGVPLAPDELKPIRSGDVIQVGGCVAHFEIRDPDFEKKLMVVPQHVRSELPVVIENPYEMINYPVPSPGGAVRVSDMYAGYSGAPNKAAQKQKTMRMVLIALAVIFLGGGLLMQNQPAKPAKAGAKVNAAFDKLAPNQQKNVKELYVVSNNLYMQQKLALAAEQLRKLHEILPEGYENSLAMAQECAQQAELENQLREIEDQKRRQEEILRTVERTISTCAPISMRSTSVDEINHCLEPALNLDPENSKVHELIARVKARIEEKQMAAMQAKDYHEHVERGRALYNKAANLDAAGEYLDALEAYRKHVNSLYPDPGGLKDKSRLQMLGIEKRMSARLDEALKAAEAAYAVGNFREAIEDIKGAKKIDPHNERAAELNGKYRRELNLKMREIYEEAVISEGLGNVDGAKLNWKKIIDTDHPDGEYYKKAKDKLHIYGGT